MARTRPSFCASGSRVPRGFLYGFEFKAKLARLNPRLFVDDSSAVAQDGEWRSSALCARPQREEGVSAFALAGVDAKTRRYVEDTASGHLPKFVCAVPTGWVPERDVFDPKTGRLLAKGWRSIILFLAKRQLVDLERARRIFSCSSLGEAAYDRMSFDQKKAAALPTRRNAFQ